MPALIRIACLLGLALLLNACCASYDPASGLSMPGPRVTSSSTNSMGIGIPGSRCPRGGKLLHGWLILDACPIADDPTRNRIFAAFDEESIEPPPSSAPRLLQSTSCDQRDGTERRPERLADLLPVLELVPSPRMEPWSGWHQRLACRFLRQDHLGMCREGHDR